MVDYSTNLSHNSFNYSYDSDQQIECKRPLHTQAKSRDHEIVRAQKKVSKGRPKIPPKSCSVVTDPQV